jgi:hypothetical protein
MNKRRQTLLNEPQPDVTQAETYTSGLPDGLFSNPKSPIWVNFGVP